MKEDKRISPTLFKYMMILLAVVIVGTALFTWMYLFLYTHEETLTILDRYAVGDRNIIVTSGPTLNCSRHYKGEILVGHTYKVRWVDGVIYDRFVKWEEVK